MSTFVGRGRELELAAAALRTSGSVLLIHGPGGIGKTRLLREALRLVQDGRTAVLHGRANQLDAELAYAPLIDALTGYLDTLTPAGQIEALEGLDVLADLLEGYGLQAPAPEVAHGADRLHRTRRLDALRRLIGRIDRPHSLLLIDDAHWADDGTLGAVAHLSRGLADAALTIVMTYRDAEAGPTLRATLTTLRRAGNVVDLPLGPIEPVAVEAILAEELRAPPTASLVRLVQDRAGGNSLYVTSLARHLRDNGLVRPGLDHRLDLVAGAAVGVPAEVEDMLAARRDHVGEAAQDVLAALGVADAPTDLELLATVTGLPQRQLEDAVDELAAAGLASEDPRSGQVSASHPLVGEAAYKALGERRRRRVHAAFVAAMEARPEPPDLGRLARHYRLAGSGVQPARAIEVLRAAADRAHVRLAPREALVHLQAAVELARRSADPALPALLGQEGVVWRMLDEEATGETVLRTAIGMVDRSRDPQLAAWLHAELATVQYYLGEPEASLTSLRTATSLDPDGTGSADVAWRRAHLAFTFDMPDELQAVAAELADRSAHDPIAALVCAFAAQDRGDLREAIELAERTLRLPEHHDDPLLGIRPRARMVVMQTGAYLGDAAPLETHRAAVIAHAEQVEAPAATWRMRLSELYLALLCGNDAQVEEVVEYLSGLGVSFKRRTLGHWWPSLIVTAWLGDLAGVRSRLAAMTGTTAETALNGRLGNDLRVICAARTGVDDPAADLARPAMTHALMPPLNLAARGLLCARRGQVQQARRLADRLEEMGDHDTAVGVLAGLVTLHLHTDAEDVLTDGAALTEICAAAGWRRLEAWVARCAAVRACDLAPDTFPASAIDLAGRAMDLASALDDRLDADSAAAVLRAAGVPRRRFRRADGDLTARQLEIAELVAQGLTNAEIAERLFISVRTVTTHLDHVYQRLEISSRHALAAKVRQGEVT